MRILETHINYSSVSRTAHDNDNCIIVNYKM